jgi:hypothetical protein
VKEGERSLGFGDLLEFGRVESEGFVNKWNNELLENFDAAIVFATGYEWFDRTAMASVFRTSKFKEPA